MFSTFDTAATLAVKDLSKAREFYENTLGLKAIHEEGSEAVSYQTGATQLFVYQSTFAGTNKATGVNWLVGDDIETIVQKLKDKKVTFEKYDMAGLKEKDGIYSSGDMKVAWFKDPDGNIIALINQKSEVKSQPKKAA